MLTKSELNLISELFSKMEGSDFVEVRDMFNLATRANIAKEANRFNVGDDVSFNDRKGSKMTGVVIKVNRKTVKVKTGQMIWSVSPSLLLKA